jgi:hypothetical protein
MGYDIEISINNLNSSHNNELEYVKSLSEQCNCIYFKENIEFDNNIKIKKIYKLVSIHFDNTDFLNIISFIHKLKKIKGVNLESIFNNDSNNLIYGSKYYLTQLVEKHFSDDFYYRRRTRSYSETDALILKEISNTNKNTKMFF